MDAEGGGHAAESVLNAFAEKDVPATTESSVKFWPEGAYGAAGGNCCAVRVDNLCRFF